MRVFAFVLGVLMQLAGFGACGYVIVRVFGRGIPPEGGGFLAAVLVAGAIVASVGARISAGEARGR